MRHMFVLALATGIVGCVPVWRTYSPPMSDLVGNNANLSGNEIIVTGKATMLAGKSIELVTRDGAGEEKAISQQEINAALDLLYEQVKLKLGLNSVDKKSISATNIKIDTLQNWAWLPTQQSFVYAGMRADKAIVDLTTNKSLTLGEISYPELGKLNISAKSDNQYVVTIDNPKVYYRIQLAKVVQTFPGDKYSNGWITQDSLGKTNIDPIMLDESKYQETWSIQPHQYFWNRWFGSYEMPNLTLVINDGDLFIRSTRGLESSLISLATFEKNGKWNEKSLYLTDFPIDELEKKFVVLDLKANRTSPSTIVVTHARIRYPELELQVAK